MFRDKPKIVLFQAPRPDSNVKLTDQPLTDGADPYQIPQNVTDIAIFETWDYSVPLISSFVKVMKAIEGRMRLEDIKMCMQREIEKVTKWNGWNYWSAHIKEFRDVIYFCGPDQDGKDGNGDLENDPSFVPLRIHKRPKHDDDDEKGRKVGPRKLELSVADWHGRDGNRDLLFISAHVADR